MVLILTCSPCLFSNWYGCKWNSFIHQTVYNCAEMVYHCFQIAFPLKYWLLFAPLECGRIKKFSIFFTLIFPHSTFLEYYLCIQNDIFSFSYWIGCKHCQWIFLTLSFTLKTQQYISTQPKTILGSLFVSS